MAINQKDGNQGLLCDQRDRKYDGINTQSTVTQYLHLEVNGTEASTCPVSTRQQWRSSHKGKHSLR